MESTTTNLSFIEEMKGYVTFGQNDFDRGYQEGTKQATFLMFHLKIQVDDVERFLSDGQHSALAEGNVRCADLGGDLAVEKGMYNLVADSGNPAHKQMFYRLHFKGADGAPVTLSGFKDIKEGSAFEVLGYTTTLFTRLLRGNVEAAEETKAEVLAAGILHIYPLDFLKQLKTFHTSAPSPAKRAEVRANFGQFYLGSLWDVYGHLITPPS